MRERSYVHAWKILDLASGSYKAGKQRFDTGIKYSEEMMMELPLTSYDNLGFAVPKKWVTFFEELPNDEAVVRAKAKADGEDEAAAVIENKTKVDLMHDIYMSLSDGEKVHVVNDMKFFFMGIGELGSLLALNSVKMYFKRHVSAPCPQNRRDGLPRGRSSPRLRGLPSRRSQSQRTSKRR